MCRDWLRPLFIQTEFELIQSEVILGKVIEDLGLNDEWGKKFADGESLKIQETMEMLKGRIDFRPVRNTSLIEIRVYSEKADEAAKIANNIADGYRPTGLTKGKRLTKGGIKAWKSDWPRRAEDRGPEKGGPIAEN